jgi:hypothetical protein
LANADGSSSMAMFGISISSTHPQLRAALLDCCLDRSHHLLHVIAYRISHAVDQNTNPHQHNHSNFADAQTETEAAA